jgi:hypothetical protein
VKIAFSVRASVSAAGSPGSELLTDPISGTTRKRTINVPRAAETNMKGDFSLAQTMLFAPSQL